MNNKIKKKGFQFLNLTPDLLNPNLQGVSTGSILLKNPLSDPEPVGTQPPLEIISVGKSRLLSVETPLGTVRQRSNTITGHGWPLEGCPQCCWPAAWWGLSLLIAPQMTVVWGGGYWVPSE
jgi:hypothetical protein